MCDIRDVQLFKSTSTEGSYGFSVIGGLCSVNGGGPLIYDIIENSPASLAGVSSIFYLQLIKVFFSKLTEDCQVDQSSPADEKLR